MIDIRLNFAATGPVDLLPVLDVGGVETGSEPYLLSDGVSLMDPIPTVLADGPFLIAGALFDVVSFGDGAGTPWSDASALYGGGTTYGAGWADEGGYLIAVPLPVGAIETSGWVDDKGLVIATPAPPHLTPVFENGVITELVDA